MSELLVLVVKLPIAFLPLYLVTKHEKQKWREDNPDYAGPAKRYQRWGARYYRPNGVQFSIRNHLLAWLWWALVVFPYHLAFA